jgi:hypothetical protein
MLRHGKSPLVTSAVAAVAALPAGRRLCLMPSTCQLSSTRMLCRRSYSTRTGVWWAASMVVQGCRTVLLSQLGCPRHCFACACDWPNSTTARELACSCGSILAVPRPLESNYATPPRMAHGISSNTPSLELVSCCCCRCTKNFLVYYNPDSKEWSR